MCEAKINSVLKKKRKINDTFKASCARRFQILSVEIENEPVAKKIIWKKKTPFCD